MKCQRCGNEAVVQQGYVLTEPIGPDATKALKLKGANGTIMADVCDGCAKMLRLRGWAEA